MSPSSASERITWGCWVWWPVDLVLRVTWSCVTRYVILCYASRDLVLHVTWGNWETGDLWTRVHIQTHNSPLPPTSYNQYILQYYGLIYMRILTEAALTISQFNLQLILVAPKSLWLVPILIRFTHKIHLQLSCLMGILCHCIVSIWYNFHFLSSEIFLA